jgi:hypothetical protein
MDHLTAITAVTALRVVTCRTDTTATATATGGFTRPSCE